MIFTPVLPLWLLIALSGVLVAFGLWQWIATIKRPGSWHWIVRILMVVVLLAIALRPTIPGTHRPPAAMGDIDIYFVVDTTSSMAAEDWDESGTGGAGGTRDGGAGESVTGRAATRLDGVKADIASIADRVPGARYALVTFDAVTVQRMPLTTDASALQSASEAMTQEITTYSRGSSIDAPVEFLTNLLTKAEEQEPGRNRIVFYLGDGEQTSGTSPASFEGIAPLIAGGAVLGYGTEEGGRMREFSGYADGSPMYIQDYTTGTDAISRMDEGNLQLIASQLGVDEMHRTPGADIDPAVDGLSVGTVTVDDQVDIRRTDELYWMIAIVLGALLLTEVGGVIGSLRELRRVKGGAA
jgi:Ca-activated chloride channel family protein